MPVSMNFPNRFLKAGGGANPLKENVLAVSKTYSRGRSALDRNWCRWVGRSAAAYLLLNRCSARVQSGREALTRSLGMGDSSGSTG